MRKNTNIIFTQTTALIVLFFLFLVSKNPLFLFVSLGALILILRSAFRIKNYNHKIYYILLLPIFVLQGLVLIYSYLFKSIYLTDPIYIVTFYFLIVIFMAYVLLYVYYYIHRQEYSKIP